MTEVMSISVLVFLVSIGHGQAHSVCLTTKSKYWYEKLKHVVEQKGVKQFCIIMHSFSLSSRKHYRSFLLDTHSVVQYTIIIISQKYDGIINRHSSFRHLLSLCSHAFLLLYMISMLDRICPSIISVMFLF